MRDDPRRITEAVVAASVFWLLVAVAVWMNVLVQAMLLVLGAFTIVTLFVFTVIVADALLNPTPANRYEDDDGRWWES